METVSSPAHVVQTWTELMVGYHGGVRDFTLKLELGDRLVNTAEELRVTQAVGFRAPMTWEFARPWVTFVMICIRQVTVDPTTGAEISNRGTRPDGEKVRTAQ